MAYQLVDATGLVLEAGPTQPTYDADTKLWQTDAVFVRDENQSLRVIYTADPVTYATLTPMQFYLAFATKERMMLKALATTGLPANSAFNSSATAIPVDPIVEEFWATYQMAVQSNAHIDPNLASIQEALEYLASPTAPTPAVITAERIPQILAGTAQ